MRFDTYATPTDPSEDRERLARQEQYQEWWDAASQYPDEVISDPGSVADRPDPERPWWLKVRDWIRDRRGQGGMSVVGNNATFEHGFENLRQVAGDVLEAEKTAGRMAAETMTGRGPLAHGFWNFVGSGAEAVQSVGAKGAELAGLITPEQRARFEDKLEEERAVMKALTEEAAPLHGTADEIVAGLTQVALGVVVAKRIIPGEGLLGFAGQGAIIDFFGFDPEDSPIFDDIGNWLGKHSPLGASALQAALVVNADDTEVEERLKRTLGGGLSGLGIDLLIRMTRVFRLGLRLKESLRGEIGAVGDPDEIEKLRRHLEAEAEELEGIAKGEIPPNGAHVYAKEDGSLGYSGKLAALENSAAADADIPFKSSTVNRLTDVQALEVARTGDNIVDYKIHSASQMGAGRNVLDSEESWNRAMSAGVERGGKTLIKSIPSVPVVALAWAKDVQKLATRVRAIMPEVRDAATAGLKQSEVLGKLWAQNKHDPAMLGELMSWAFLSRNATPFTHEGGFLQTFPAIDRAWSEIITNGKLSKESLKALTDVPGSIASSLSPSRSITHNINGLAKFMQWAGRDGNFARLSQELAKAQTGREFRRAFWRVVGDEPLGIDNKLLSFMALTLGFKDVVVMDTQFLQMIYGASPGAIKRLMKDGFAGALGAARYEQLEEALAPLVAKAYNGVVDEFGQALEPSLARFHWENWLHQSNQVTDHPTLQALVKHYSGVPAEEAVRGIEVPAGKNDGWMAGLQYSVDNGGTMVWTAQRGSTYRLTLEQAQQALNVIREAAQDPNLAVQLDWLFKATHHVDPDDPYRVLRPDFPKEFRVGEQFQKTGLPYFENPEVDRNALDQVFRHASKGESFTGNDLIQAGFDYAESVQAARSARSRRYTAAGRKKLAEEITLTHNSAVETNPEAAGSTFSMAFGNVSEADVWSVGVYPERAVAIPGEVLPEKELLAFIEENKSILKDPRLGIGTWYDKAKNETVLDVVALVADDAHAAALGRNYNQQGIFHLGRKEYVSTEGDGLLATWLGTTQPDQNLKSWKKLSINKRLMDSPAETQSRKLGGLHELSKAFKEFIGRSKITFEVFHGTPAVFDSFERTVDIGFHFGTEAQARKRLEVTGLVPGKGRLESFYIRLENPAVVSDLGSWHPLETVAEMYRRGYLEESDVRKVFEAAFDDADLLPEDEFERLLKELLDGDAIDARFAFDELDPSRELRAQVHSVTRERMMDAGYDGLIYKNEAEGAGESYVVFEDVQIKSAKMNSGAFGVNDPRYYHGGIAGGIAGGALAAQDQEKETVNLNQLEDSILQYKKQNGLETDADRDRTLKILGGIAAGALGVGAAAALLKRTAPRFASRAIAETEAHGLNSMIDASTHPNVAGKLSREQTDQVFKLADYMTGGQINVREIAKLLVDTKWNISYMTAPEQVRNIHTAMVDTFREAFDAVRRQPEGKKVAESFREAIIEMNGLSVDQAKVVFPDLVARTQDLDVELLVANMVLRDMGQQLAGFAKQIDASPGTRRAILDRARPLLEAYLDSSLAYSGAKSEVGRALNILKYVKGRGEVGHAVTGAVVGGLAAPAALEGEEGESDTGSKIAKHALGAAVGAAVGVGASRLVRGARQAVRGSSISLAKGSQQLTAGMNQRDIEKVLRLFDLSDGSPRDVVAISKAIEAKVGKSGGWSKAQEVFYNSILSAPVTWGTVTTSGVALTSFEAASRIAAGVARFGYTGNTALLREGLDMTAAHFRYFEESFVAGWKALKAGRSIIDPSPIPGAIGGKLGAAIRTPSRLMQALDEATTTANYRAYVRAKALRAAREAAAARGLKGKQATDYIMRRAEEDVASAFDNESGIALVPEALEFARVPAGTAALDPASFSGRFQKFASSTPLLKFIVPFVRAPSNLMRYAFMDSSPLGLMSPRIRQAIRAGGEQRDVTLARMALGTSLLGAAGAWAASGKITGNGPNDPKLRELWLKDHQPYSINLGGTWYSYRRLEPFGSLMGATADASQAYAEYAMEAQESDANALDGVFAALLSGFVENFTNKSYAAGLNMFFDAMSGDVHSASRWLTNFGTAFAIPRGVQAVGEMVTDDPYSRQARTALTRFLDKVPGWSPRLPLRYNIFGEPHQRSSVGESRAEALWHPIASRPVTESVETKLATLPKGFSLPGPIKRVLGHRIDLNDPGWKNNTGKDITPYARWMELIRDGVEGQGSLRSAVEQYVNSEQWETATQRAESFFTTDPRWEAVNEILQDRYAQAELQMLAEFPDLAQAKSYGGILSQLEGQDITNSYIKEALDKLKPPTKRGK